MQILNSGTDDAAGRFEADVAAARAVISTVQGKLDRLLDLGTRK